MWSISSTCTTCSKRQVADILKYLAAAAVLYCLPEIKELEEYGITRIYSPDDGRAMGLQGMIDDLLHAAATSQPAIN
jgi:methylmalonyl-CoA mutase